MYLKFIMLSLIAFCAVTFNALFANPVITSIDTNLCSKFGFALVTITGTGFPTTINDPPATGDLEVTFAGAPPLLVIPRSDTTILAISPPHIIDINRYPDVVDIVVQIHGVPNSGSKIKFTYYNYPAPLEITSIDPNFSDFNKPTLVIIRGTGFLSGADSTVVNYGAEGAPYNKKLTPLSFPGTGFILDNIMQVVIPAQPQIPSPPASVPISTTITYPKELFFGNPVPPPATSNSIKFSYIPAFNQPGYASVLNYMSNSVSTISTFTKEEKTTNVGTKPSTQVFNSSGTRSYIIDSGVKSVSVIEPSSGTAILPPITVGRGPTAIAITPDDKTVYVTNYVDNTVSAIDTATSSVITIPVGNGPSNIAITSDGKTAAVVNSLSNNITFINAQTRRAIASTIDIGSNLKLIVINPDNTFAYVTSRDGIVVINMQTFTIEKSIFNKETFNFSAIALTPPTTSTLPRGNKLYAADFGKGIVYVIDTKTNTPTTMIDVHLSSDNPQPASIVISPDGTKVYVANFGGNEIAIIDTSTDKVTSKISQIDGKLSNPIDMALTPSGKELYIANYGNNTTSVIFTGTLTLVNVKTVGNNPVNVSITPDQPPIARFVPTPTQGLNVRFDATSSDSAGGEITKYQWDFGDRTPPVPVIVTVPIILHQYAAPGRYQVTLTLTNSLGTSTTPIYSYNSQFVDFLPNVTNFIVKGQSLINNGRPRAKITQTVEVSNSTAIIVGPMMPPEDPKGFQIKNKFPTQTEFVNVVTWKAPLIGLAPVAYHIYRDPSLTKKVGTILAIQPFRFEDHNRKKGRTYKYYIVSVDSAGDMSSPVVVIVKGNKRK